MTVFTNSCQSYQKALANYHDGMTAFEIEDIARLDDWSVQRLLRRVPWRDVVLALVGAPASVRARAMRNVSVRRQADLKEELARWSDRPRTPAMDRAREALRREAAQLLEADFIRFDPERRETGKLTSDEIDELFAILKSREADQDKPR